MNIIQGNFNTTLDIPPDRILENAIGILDKVLIIGVQKDGKMFCAASGADAGEHLLFVERFKKQLLQIVEGD